MDELNTCESRNVKTAFSWHALFLRIRKMGTQFGVPYTAASNSTDRKTKSAEDDVHVLNVLKTKLTHMCAKIKNRLAMLSHQKEFTLLDGHVLAALC